MGKLKLRLTAIALIALIITLLTQGSLAYYTTVGKATNVVTSGNIQFIIHEKTDSGEDFPVDGVYVIPGDVVSKRVTVESDCEHPFYLRVKIVYGINSVELPADDCFKLNINEEYWQLHTDGWYYYKGVVEPGQTTPYVFSHVEIVGSQVSTEYIGKTLTLSVVAHAVQSENNPVEGTDTFNAFGWPADEAS